MIYCPVVTRLGEGLIYTSYPETICSGDIRLRLAVLVGYPINHYIFPFHTSVSTHTDIQ